MLHYRDIHGYRRAYRLAGDGPPLLLVHGIGDSSGTWSHVLPMLAEHHTVIAPDLLGHGASAKPRADYAIGAFACGLRDLLTTLDIDRVSVAGHSLGGGVAMQFAYQFPERVERLALVGSAGLGREVHPAFRLAAGPGAGIALSLLTTPPARAAVRLATPALRVLCGGGLGRDLDHVLERYHDFADGTARRAFLRTIRAGIDLRGQAITMLDRGYLARGLPTLVVWGGRDPIIPAAHARIAQAALPGSRLEVFPDSGHFPHRDEPERFAAVLTDFLAGRAADHDRDDWRELLRAGRAAEPPEPSSGT
ncbi:alpha/beta fold hydrolase [Actinomadura flavalba]|uniref:alpha/beta fold hydrolase n=1 Tax=Actinomadura flavalba TaxID=1120938 RepID=UPI000365462D|nr:alpha/beta fold hydrolase [Actinomadura flavalba]